MSLKEDVSAIERGVRRLQNSAIASATTVLAELKEARARGLPAQELLQVNNAALTVANNLVSLATRSAPKTDEQLKRATLMVEIAREIKSEAL